jgi:hypothetical protein
MGNAKRINLHPDPRDVNKSTGSVTCYECDGSKRCSQCNGTGVA